jgi:hypothetical protein
MGGGPQVLSRDSIREASPRLAWTRGPGRRVYLASSVPGPIRKKRYLQATAHRPRRHPARPREELLRAPSNPPQPPRRILRETTRTGLVSFQLMSDDSRARFCRRRARHRQRERHGSTVSGRCSRSVRWWRAEPFV